MWNILQKLCKSGASQLTGILTAVNSGIFLAISYFLIFSHNNDFISFQKCQNTWTLTLLNDILGIYAYPSHQRRGFWIWKHRVYAHSQETPAICLSKLCFYSDLKKKIILLLHTQTANPLTQGYWSGSLQHRHRLSGNFARTSPCTSHPNPHSSSIFYISSSPICLEQEIKATAAMKMAHNICLKWSWQTFLVSVPDSKNELISHFGDLLNRVWIKWKKKPSK